MCGVLPDGSAWRVRKVGVAITYGFRIYQLPRKRAGPDFKTTADKCGAVGDIRVLMPGSVDFALSAGRRVNIIWISHISYAFSRGGVNGPLSIARNVYAAK